MPNENEPAEVIAEDGGAIIEIADGTVTPAPAPAAKPAAETPAPEVVIVPDPAPAHVSEGVEELRAQLRAREDRDAASNQERSRIQEHNRQLQEANQRYQEETQRAQSEALDSRRSEIDSGIAAAQAEVESARRQYKASLEAGDFEGASEANVKVNEAASSLVYLKHRKADFDVPGQRPIVNPQGRVEATQNQQPQATQGDPTERYIQEKSPRTGAWLRKHMECVTDPRSNKRAVAAHFEAEAEGYVQDTDAYFDFLDKKLGFSQPAPRAAEEPRRSPATKPAPPAAPVSRETPRSQELGNSRIYLTKGELETADALGITPAEYGKRKQAMTKQGFYSS